MNTPPANLRTLGDRLRYRRRQMGLTQDVLGGLSGTNQAVIQKIENGNSIHPRKIHEIAEVLQVKPAWLLFGENDPIPPHPEVEIFVNNWSRLNEAQQTKLAEMCQRMLGETHTGRSG